GTFAATLSSRSSANNPVVRAAYHLRHTGIRHTLVLTRRYLRNRLDPLWSRRLVRGLASRWTSRRRDGGTEVLFGLAVLQHQLNGLEQQLANVQERLERIEDRLDSAE